MRPDPRVVTQRKRRIANLEAFAAVRRIMEYCADDARGFTVKREDGIRLASKFFSYLPDHQTSVDVMSTSTQLNLACATATRTNVSTEEAVESGLLFQICLLESEMFARLARNCKESLDAVEVGDGRRGTALAANALEGTLDKRVFWHALPLVNAFASGLTFGELAQQAKRASELFNPDRANAAEVAAETDGSEPWPILKSFFNDMTNHADKTSEKYFHQAVAAEDLIMVLTGKTRSDELIAEQLQLTLAKVGNLDGPSGEPVGTSDQPFDGSTPVNFYVHSFLSSFCFGPDTIKHLRTTTDLTPAAFQLFDSAPGPLTRGL